MAIYNFSVEVEVTGDRQSAYDYLWETLMGGVDMLDDEQTPDLISINLPSINEQRED